MQLNGRLINADGDRLHRRAYIYLRDQARLYITSNIGPLLAELEKPWLHSSRALCPELRAVLDAAGEELIDPELLEEPIGATLVNPWEDEEVLVQG